jgi:hypothetical protein
MPGKGNSFAFWYFSRSADEAAGNSDVFGDRDTTEADADADCIITGGGWLATGVVTTSTLSVFALVRLAPLSRLTLESVLSRRVTMLFVRERRPAADPDRNVPLILSQVLVEAPSQFRLPASSQSNSAVSGERSCVRDATDNLAGYCWGDVESSLAVRTIDVG